MKRLFLALTAVLFAIAAPSAQQSPRADRQLTGADLLQSCGGSDPLLREFCAGYVQGVIDVGLNGADVFDPEALCLPSGTARADIIASVNDILSALPETAEDPAPVVILRLMQFIYVC